MVLQTCVSPEGQFVYGIHKPRFKVKNLRGKAVVSTIGKHEDGRLIDNCANFPAGDVTVSEADWVYEIPNAFPFKGTTYISKYFADINARNPESFALPDRQPVSLRETLKQWTEEKELPVKSMIDLYRNLPGPLLLALATTSTDPQELACLAELSCQFTCDEKSGRPAGLVYQSARNGQVWAKIHNLPLFKALANNRFLPDDYKAVMVLRPGAQGGSEIVGQWQTPEHPSHVFEYFRRNSYIPWGHYAANMADDAIRYDIRDLTLADMRGMRHLYYQRTYIRLADGFGLPMPNTGGNLSEDQLEDLRFRINDAISNNKKKLAFTGTLWGWNYGFDYAPTGYRLHGSHQQIHQQYALIPENVQIETPDETISTFACGDLVGAFIADYQQQYGKPFFDCYIRAIKNNRRIDGKKNGDRRLVVYEDDQVMVFVPKAQTSQWELQLMTLKPVGNILETDVHIRRALDRAMLIAVKTLSAMGAKMITGIEYAKRFDNPDTDQRLLYCFLPRLPQSPGAFSEAQLRWINRHYPEDFAAACRNRLADLP